MHIQDLKLGCSKYSLFFINWLNLFLYLQGKELPSLFPKPKSNPEPKIEEGYYGPVRDTLRLGYVGIETFLS